MERTEAAELVSALIVAGLKDVQCRRNAWGESGFVVVAWIDGNTLAHTEEDIAAAYAVSPFRVGHKGELVWS